MGLDLPDLILTGLQEAFSPPLMAVAGILGLACFILRPSGKDALRVFFVKFMVTLVMLRVFLDSGAANVLVFSPRFLAAAVWAYGLIGAIFLVTGGAFFYERLALIRDGSLPFAGFLRGVKLGKVGLSVLATVAAVVAALWISAWPLSYRVALQGGMLFSVYGFLDALRGLVLYEILRNSGSLLAGVVFLLSLSGKPAEVLRARKTLVAVMMSAVYLAAGGSLLSFCYMVHVGP